MNKAERIRRMAAAVGIGFASAFVTDRVVNNQVSIPVHLETPVATLPEKTVLIFSSRDKRFSR